MGRDKVLEAILVIVTGLLVFYFIFEIDELVYIALVVAVISLLSKWVASKIVWLWYKLSEVMGYVMSRILLSAVFFLFLYPISILYKLFNKDPLKLRRSDQSYYESRDHKYTAKDLKNPW
ncbi:MAG: hypothetical protein COB85_00295 [Bacteroidetes bacterium]|nr:MAG: hypothetical protein COB85_00295 [Bacteroidota bacterium]